jgi:hypothetical protein
MAQSQYCHFPSRAEEGAEAMILPAGGHDRMRCFTDQVKLTHALVQNLDEAIKEVKLVGEHEEEKATLEEKLETHDELRMEITREMGLDHMGEDEDEEEEEEDAEDGGDATAPRAVVLEEIDEESPVEAIPVK